MADYDGKIQLAMDVSPEEAIKSFQKLASKAQQQLNKLSTDNLTKSQEKSLATMSKLTSKGEELVRQLKQLSQPVQTKEYTKLSNEYEKLSQKIEDLDRKRKQLIDKGGKNSDANVKAINDKLSTMRSKLDDIDIELDKMVAEGKQFEINDASLEKTKNALVDINNQIHINQAANGELIDEQAKSAEQLADKVAKVLETQFNAGERNAEVQQLVKDLEDVEVVLEHLRDRQQELEQAGVGLGYAEYDKNLAEIRELEEEQGRLNQKLEEYREKQSQQNQGLSESAMRIQDIQASAGAMNSKFAETSAALERVKNELEQLTERQRQLEEAGRGAGYAEYEQNLAKIQQLTQEQSKLNQMVEEYRTSQEKIGQITHIWDSMTAAIERLGITLRHPIQSLIELVTNSNLVEKALQGLGNVASSVTSKFQQLMSTIGRLARSFFTSVTGIDRLKSALSGVASRANQSTFSFKKLFNTLLKYGIGIRSLYVLFRKLRTAIVDGLNTMVLYNGGVNQTNAAMTSLVSSLNYVKGSLATAFAPLLTVVSPMLSSFMAQLADVITMVGMFIARLTGARSYMKATFKSTDYAKSLSGGGGGGGKSAQQKYEEAVEKAQKKYDEQVAKITARNEKAEAKAAEKNAENMAKAEDKQAKAAEKLAKEQEKANNKLAAFDDLNVLGIESVEDETDALEELEEIQAELAEMPELELPSLEDFLGGGGGGSESPFGLEEVPLDSLEWNWDDIKAKAEELGRGLADKLNDFFANEDLAAEIGRNIAELLNTALHFAYGFIDQFNWHQMGRWFGTLIREGIETFEWDLLGKTIGELLNGLADTIIGFFETYPVGLLGSSMAEMFNNAIATIDPNKLGEAVADVLKAPFIELSHFFTETNWSELGHKLYEFIHEALTSRELNGETLGTTIGNCLRDGFNAAVEFLKNVHLTQLIIAFVGFFTDLFKGAMEGVHWADVFDIIYDIFNGLVTVLVILFMELGNKIARALHQEDWFPQDEIDLMKDGFITAFDLMSGSVDDFKRALLLIESGVIPSASALKELQDQCGFTDDQMDQLIRKIQEVDPTFDAATYGLEGYTGSWADFTAQVEDSGTRVTDVLNTTNAGITTVLKESTDAATELGDTIGVTADEFTTSMEEIRVQTGAIEEATQRAEENARITADANRQGLELLFSPLTDLIEKIFGVKDSVDEVKTSTDEVKASTEELGIATDSVTTNSMDKIRFWTDPLYAFKTLLGLTTDETTELGETTTTVTNQMNTNYANLSGNVQATTGTLTRSISEVDGAMATSERNVATYSTNAVTSIDGISTKADDTKLNFENMAIEINTILENLTTEIQTWYENIVATYFSYDAWTLLITEGMLQAIIDGFVLFFETWDLSLQDWWTNHVLVWVDNNKWQTEIYTPWMNYLKTRWTAFITWWDTSMKDWWTNHLLKPWAQNNKWDTEFYNPIKKNMRETHWTDSFIKWWDTAIKDWWTNHLLDPWTKNDKWDKDVYTPIKTNMRDTHWKQFVEWWDTAIKDWWDKHLIDPWTTDRQWDEKVYKPIEDNMQKTHWEAFIRWWDEAIQDWWEKHVEPWVEKINETIDQLSQDIKDATDETFTVVEETITEKIQAAEGAVKAACEEMIRAIQAVMAAMAELEAMGGGGGGSSSPSGSGGGGSSSGGRSGGARSFMPMLDVMHFEDNLGMSAFSFPELATGAVIPPNNEFLAVLGDQKRGYNIETPLNTMLEAFRTVMDEYNSPQPQQEAVMEVDGETFARLMLPYVMNEMNRQGYNTEIIEGI